LDQTILSGAEKGKINVLINRIAVTLKSLNIRFQCLNSPTTFIIIISKSSIFS